MKEFLVKLLYPLLKVSKPYLRRWAKKHLIPYLKNEIKARDKGIIKKIDKIIEVAVIAAIEEL